ncbi:MAG TPA: phosphatase PAP2 family protein [Actinocrinis sp.]|uniref:bifunctional phosphatase PAP2/diacylglycerol kinase family protein n=1 Tax=Actinocrinis sp. TaxID=1920516 RepID=UPI002D2E434F|nr:phosphatase PAP2 family protein [Actinocrinis sp.]HZU55767.1 phosphatase PAP2 family protein [Actinocrinis sp.]
MSVRPLPFSGFDRRLMSAVSPERSRVLDHLLPKLGRAADHSKLWIALAATMAATPRRGTRRAAMRGMAAVSLASASANLVGKTMIRRQRPGLVDIPLIRQLRRVPDSSSFPSGHAASAAAFATGVALETPYLALPVAALAAGVAASRVVTGVHYPTDVVAGAAVGVAAGLLTTRWWPPLDPEPAQAPPAGSEAPALPTGEGLILVINPAAGNGSAQAGAEENGGGRLAQQIRQELPAAEIVVAQEGADLPGLLEQAAKRAAVLGVAGGDGTINAAVGAALRAGVPLLVVPAGTLNHFARDIGIESVEDAVTALRNGDAIAVDVGTVNDHVFVNTFSVGAYVDLVHARERYEHRLGKWPAVLAGAIEVLRDGKPVVCRVDGVERRLWLLFAGNCRYQPAGLAPSGRPRLEDGDLDIRIVDAARPLARIRLLAALATGTLATSRVYQYRAATTLSLTSVGSDAGSGAGSAAGRGPDSASGPGLSYSVDGEVAGTEPELSVGKLPRSLIVYRPAAPVM